MVHAKDIDNMLDNLRSSINRNNCKIGKQKVQNYDAAKLGHLMQLATKVKISKLL